MNDQSTTNILAIDPGKQGAIAWYCCGDYGVENLGETTPEQDEQIARLVHDHLITHCVLEWLESVPPVFIPNKETGKSERANRETQAYRDGTRTGALYGIMVARKLAVRRANPKVWIPALLTTVPKAKPARKTAIWETVQRLFPGMRITKRNADAVGIMAWALGMR